LRRSNTLVQSGSTPLRRQGARFCSAADLNRLAADQEPLLDSTQCSAYAWVVCGEKAHQRHQQKACVSSLGTVGLHEAVELAIKTTLADLCMDFIGERTPAASLLARSLNASAAAERSKATQAILTPPG
jgi:hypothetical protein